MRSLFLLAAFLSSGLLFIVEPMAAKGILPTFGGSPAVWNTSLLFFQAALLLGYLYAHVSNSKLPSVTQRVVHLAVFAVAAVSLPISFHSGWFHQVRVWAAEERAPAPLILLALSGLVGLPFFALSANSSTLQRWYSTSGRPDAAQPWFLYAAGNLGSMIALLAYPSIVEPTLTLSQQGLFWSVGYGVLGALLVLCALTSRTNGRVAEPLIPETEAGLPAVDESPQATVAEPVTSKRKWTWLALSAVPSSLLMGVTTYLTSNITPIPLLWVVPLALYLLTFILVFARKPKAPAALLGRIFPLILTPLVLIMVLEGVSTPLALIHLAVFFIAVWMCHSRLALLKPSAEHLTEYFFYLSLGGVVGGVFSALIAPVVFSTLFEYPVALVAAAMLIPVRTDLKKKLNVGLGYPILIGLVMAGDAVLMRSLHQQGTIYNSFVAIGLPTVLCFLAVDSPLWFGLSIGAVFLVANLLSVASVGSVPFTARSFFGVHRIIRSHGGTMFELANGNTTHGIQDRTHPTEALTYYTKDGPIGQVMTDVKPPTAAFVGLGVGSLAAYGHPGQQFTYYEIDPVVVQVASDPRWFTFLHDSRAQVRIVLGDARLQLAKSPETYDLIVLDAFSSDAIPIHLLTKEAIGMYVRHLKPGGMLAFHISNRYLNLAPVLSAACRDLRLLCYDQVDGATDMDKARGKRESEWVIAAPDKSAFLKLTLSWWDEVEPTKRRAWTDDFSNVLSTFKLQAD
ncbi:MAG TPA: fused MFS/spermidine synthase [Fimbriimonas sp.]|nr:fused MFS/spermidine synthase [Fimbriimonas sp.]